jgi:hypothetical protein
VARQYRQSVTGQLSDDDTEPARSELVASQT